MINLKEIAKVMSDRNIILTYQGVLDPDVISELLDFVELRLKERKIKKSLRKKVYMIMLETLQNSLKHGSSKLTDENRRTTTALIHKDDNFELTLGNSVFVENKINLEKSLELINSLSEEKLKEKYLEILNNGIQSAVGGSGLGLIDIARKSGNKLDYRFDEMDQENFYFTLNIIIS